MVTQSARLLATVRGTALPPHVLTTSWHVLSLSLRGRARRFSVLSGYVLLVTAGHGLRAHQAHAWPATPVTVCPRAYTWPRLYQLLRGSVRPRRDRSHKTRLMPTGGRRVGSNKALAATYVPAIVLPARPPPDSRSGNEAGCESVGDPKLGLVPARGAYQLALGVRVRARAYRLWLD